MKVLFLDCSMGIAGDMLMGALLDLVPNREECLEKLNAMGIPGIQISAKASEKCGILGTHMCVRIHGEEEEEHLSHHEVHSQEGTHDYHRGHIHRNLAEIESMIEKLYAPEKVKTVAKAIYKNIAEAEGKAHGKEVTQVHFHEVGMLDAIADVMGCALLMEELHVDKVIATPVNVGFGQVSCAHGIMPVPAPATANLLIGIPSYAGEIKGELCTPTGAALLKYFVNEFSQMPFIKIEKIGYGIGTKEFMVPNCVRGILGETQDGQEDVLELKCNIDDMTAEEVSYASELLMQKGALDVYTIAIGMKKSRQGIMLCILCKEENKDNLLQLIFNNTSTIGVRICKHERVTLIRKIEERDTAFGKVRWKVSSGFGVQKEKAEFEDLKSIAQRHNLSIQKVREIVHDKN